MAAAKARVIPITSPRSVAKCTPTCCFPSAAVTEPSTRRATMEGMRRLPLADRLRVESPCVVPGAWDALGDGERVRFCGTCNLHVHDVAELSP